MKTKLIAMSLLGSVIVMAQTVTTGDNFEANTNRSAREALVIEAVEPQNHVKAGNVTLSGIAVAVVQADNKLQLLNPVAPGKYGTVEDSVVRDPVTGAAAGLKIFSIKF